MQQTSDGQYAVKFIINSCIKKKFYKGRNISTITIEHLMSHGLFYWWPCYVSGPGNITVVLLSMMGQRALGFHQKHLNLCSEDEQRYYDFVTMWGWVIKDRIFIFGRTIPLNCANYVFLYCYKRIWAVGFGWSLSMKLSSCILFVW